MKTNEKNNVYYSGRNQLTGQKTISIGKTSFQDLPGFTAEPFLNGFIIHSTGQFGRAVGFYNPELKILDVQTDPRQLQQCDDLHQAMRLAFLLLQKGKIPAIESVTSGQITEDEEGIISFSEIPGWKAKPFLVFESIDKKILQETLQGYDIYIDREYHIGHYNVHSKILTLYQSGLPEQVPELSDLIQAVRYTYLITRKAKT